MAEQGDQKPRKTHQPIDFVIPDHVPILHLDISMVEYRRNDGLFYLSIYQRQLENLSGRLGETITVTPRRVRAVCVARFALNERAMGSLLGSVTEAVKAHSARQAAKKRDEQ